jgi:preprotein translocase subunit YajC
MELLLLLIVAGVIGYFIGDWRRKRANAKASQEVVEATAKDVVDAEK